ncbi:homoserine kinase [Lactobacillus sp. S2-2]|uniref:homoserine kinase n=1 Tax=Lactobacillus sp. S2-2 TaxID=2692917 RepID=UPI001F016634|nr:homoserine kinase [Lactobacillus sp. S2-2]
MEKLIVRVPATSGNVGNGFNSIGLALHLYYTVIVEEETEVWKINHALGDNIPTDKNNLIVQTILKIKPDIKPHQLTVMSDIPVEHGLGSSTTAVVAGIKIANSIGKLKMTMEDEINLVTKFDGNPDNSAAAILGGLTISHYNGEIVDSEKTELPEDIKALIFIKTNGITEKESIKELPKVIGLMNAVNSSSASNLFIAALMNKDWDKAAKIMEVDNFVEKSRTKDYSILKKIREIAHEHNVHSTFISGAGSTIITLGKEEQLVKIREQLKDLDGKTKIVKLANNGTEIRGELD